MHCGNPLIRLCVLVNFDRRRLELDGYLTAAPALLAPAALPPVLADAAAAALLALAAPPPVLADAAAAALLALVAPPPVLTDAAAAALLAVVALPPVRTAGWHVSVEGALRPYLAGGGAQVELSIFCAELSAQPHACHARILYVSTNPNL